MEQKFANDEDIEMTEEDCTYYDHQHLSQQQQEGHQKSADEVQETHEDKKEIDKQEQSIEQKHHSKDKSKEKDNNNNSQQQEEQDKDKKNDNEIEEQKSQQQNNQVDIKQEDEESKELSVSDHIKKLQDKDSLEKLKALGYQILKESEDDYGKFRQLKDPSKALEWKGQQHYDFIGDAIIDYVQSEMKNQLKELWIPEDKDLDEEYRHLPRCNIFLNENFLSSKRSKALILIQGTGSVRAGIWARSVCINESLEKGSMLPFLRVAEKNNLDVIVMNPNYNRDPKTNQVIPYSHSMTAHALFVWDKYIENSKHDELYIVAHSAGGSCLAAIQQQFSNTFYERVKQIALTDSWTISKDKLSKPQLKFMKENCIHYVASEKSVNTIIKTKKNNVCMEVSAGHSKHEYTTGYAFNSIIRQFNFQF